MSKGRFVNHNGKITSASSINLGTENRSFRYGDGLFETIRGVKGKLPFWQFHMQRLKQGMDVLGLDYSKWNWDDLRNQAENLLVENEQVNGSRLRISAYRSGEGNYRPEKSEAEYVMDSTKLPNELFTINEKGLNVDYYTRIKKPVNLLSMVKSANALLYVLAAEEAKNKGLDDVLILNQNNELCEASSSNVFIIRDDKVFTPPLSSGCLPGIMRMVLISILSKKGLQVQETPMSPNDLIMAKEVFLTSSISGIRWVGGFQNKRYYKNYSELFLEDINKLIQ